MKRKIGMFVAALAFGLLMSAGNVSATPFESCESDGQQGWTYEMVNGQNGWHIWQCQAGNWQYQHYCGENICIV